MKELNQIEREANALITSSLQEQNSVDIPAIGCFTPLFHPEYIWEDESSGVRSKTLIPPHITLSLNPSDYLLNHSHYTCIDFVPPIDYLESEFISNLADLHEHHENEVREALTSHIEIFLRDLFKGRRTSLLDIGEFYITEEGEGSLLLNFLASEEMLKSLNFVFSAYQQIEINPAADFSDTETRWELHTNTPIQISIPKPIIPKVVAEEEIIAPQNDIGVETSKAIEVIEEEKVVSNSVEIPTEPKKKRSYIWLILLSLGGIIAIVAIISLNGNRAKVEPNIEDTPIKTPPKVVAKVEPPKEILPIDTVTAKTGSTLAKFARQYYDNSYYWVYIYFANHKSIKDPNNLEIGTKLLIPNLEKYHLLSDPKEALKEAKEWATLIQLGSFTSYEEDRKKLPMNRINE